MESTACIEVVDIASVVPTNTVSVGFISELVMAASVAAAVITSVVIGYHVAVAFFVSLFFLVGGSLVSGAEDRFLVE